MPNELAVHISHFPTEIIQDIFSLCILPFNSRMNFCYASGKDKDENDGDAIYKQKMFRIGSSPWAVGQTCHRWRDIAWGTPSLWTHINIDVADADFEESFQRPCIPLQLFLERSQDTSLHIRLNYDSSYYRNAHPILDLLIAQSYRWYTAELCISLPEYAILDGVSSRVPRLHRLAFNVINDEEDTWETPSDPSIDFFSTAPQLRSLELNKHEDMHSFRVPWSQLTRLDFYFFDVDQLEWFKETTNLKICTIKFAADWYSPPKECITLVNLHTLRFSWVDSTMGISQFQYIIVPALVELEILALDGTVGLYEVITSLLHQSGCSLKKFSIHSVPEDIISVLELLQKMPSLEYLCIRGLMLMKNDLIKRLTLPLTGLPVAPRLHTIDFTLTGHKDFSHDLFVDMIESRWARRLQSSSALPLNAVDEETARLQSVIIRPAFAFPHRYPMPPNAKERLERLQTEGLNVEFLSAEHTDVSG